MFAPRHAFAIAALFAVLSSSFQVEANDNSRLTPQNMESCAQLPSDRERLDCYQALTGGQTSPAATSPTDASQWHILRTRGPDGGSLSIIHTPDTSHSDADFAGFSIHCGKNGPEFLLIIINPLPPRARPTVTVAGSGKPIRFAATLLPSGASLLLPPESRTLAQGAWRTQGDVDFTISERDYSLHGVVSFRGFTQALSALSAACPAH